MNKIAVNNGLFLGIVLMISSLLLYFANVQLFLFYRSFILLAVVILLFIKTGRDARTANGGFISFGSVFKTIFGAAAIGFLICTIFENIHFNIIDPTLADQLRDLSLTKLEETMEMIGMGDSPDMEKAIEEIENADMSVTPMVSIKNYAIRLIFPGAVIGAIIAAILKKNNPSEIMA